MWLYVRATIVLNTKKTLSILPLSWYRETGRSGVTWLESISDGGSRMTLIVVRLCGVWTVRLRRIASQSCIGTRMSSCAVDMVDRIHSPRSRMDSIIHTLTIEDRIIHVGRRIIDIYHSICQCLIIPWICRLTMFTVNQKIIHRRLWVTSPVAVETPNYCATPRCVEILHDKGIK
jgi:hypothetical protein